MRYSNCLLAVVAGLGFTLLGFTTASSSEILTGHPYLLAFNGFENGIGETIELDQKWDGVPDPHEAEAVQISDGVAREGTQSLRIHIDYDWDFREVSSVRVGPMPGRRFKDYLKQHDWCVWRVPFWHSFSIYIPEDWVPDTVVEQVHEFHRDASKNPGETIQEMFKAAGWSIGDGKPMTVRVEADSMVFVNHYETDAEEKRRDRAWLPIEAGTWYDIAMHVKWSTAGDGDTGFMHIWVNGEPVYSHVGNTAVRDLEPPRAPKFGVYKWLWDGGRQVDQTHRTYYFDAFTYGKANARPYYEAGGLVPPPSPSDHPSDF